MTATALAMAAEVATLPWPAVVAWLAIVATAAGHEHAPRARRGVGRVN